LLWFVYFAILPFSLYLRVGVNKCLRTVASKLDLLIDTESWCTEPCI
jgi:hypothetical protein